MKRGLVATLVTAGALGLGGGLALGATHRLDHGTADQLVPVAGTIRDDGDGFAVVDANHLHVGIGRIRCLDNGALEVMVSPVGWIDGAYQVGMDGVLNRRGVTAGWSVSPDRIRISFARTDEDGVHGIPCDDPALQGGGSNVWITGYQAVR